MHTSGHTRHTIKRRGDLYYNRRVPSHAQAAFGKLIRAKVDDEAHADALTRRLDSIFDCREPVAVALSDLLATCRPHRTDLASITDEYLAVKGIQENPTRSTVAYFTALVGNRSVADYTRHDARIFIAWMLDNGRKTKSARRRVNCLTAIFNYAYTELEIERRNPFSSLLIAHEGKDRQQREPFATEELARAYEAALTGTSRLRLCVPILGETGCRIAEVIGLRKQDVDLQQEKIRIAGHPSRTLKTSGSEREIPLVGVALEAANRLMVDTESDFLFPAYTNKEICKATHASNALNKWLKREFGGKTAHCLRHAFRDRLRAVECPLELIDALGGWSSVGTAGSRYGRGFDLEHKRKWLASIGFPLTTEFSFGD